MRAAIGGKPAGENLATPRSGLPFNAAEVVAGGIVACPWGLRCRRHPHNRDGTLRPFKMHERMHVIVAVQHELGSMPREHRAKLTPVDKPLEMPARA